ncbi:hypothetical protein [Hymenobacter sp. IS2118]|uniref:hypothetical protein n=1 Tax=Hymenobacter sp. IS2118 TaxID=1505605 RepID=UPI000550B89E|nr:hypothetical protein [Hymenobacter sp. IS2118]
MNNDETNLNTESNDIAGNRVDGPIGNTATQHTRPGAGTGIPGGAPAPAAAGRPAVSTPGAPASSESLADSETSVADGAVDAENDEQENKEANPDDLRPTQRYGGNFGNSTQGSYNDRERLENQNSDPSRGEFGAQDLGGTTQGGYGNQNRLSGPDEPRNAGEEKYYGGSAGRPGPQDNSYRAYDGGNYQTDAPANYGFEAGAPVAATSGRAADAGQMQGTDFDGPSGDNRNQPDRADPNSAFQVDNGSAATNDRGYADDYGNTSLRRPDASTGGATAPVSKGNQETVSESRNQTEDYRPNQSGFDKQGHREEQHPGYSTNTPEFADQRGQQPASSRGDRGREPDFRTGDDRNGYVEGNGGDTSLGMGSEGGSYNDAYDDSQPGSNAGSPAQGDQRLEDRAQNYGQTARQQNRSTDDENEADHGAPRRNAGRDGEGND